MFQFVKLVRLPGRVSWPCAHQINPWWDFQTLSTPPAVAVPASRPAVAMTLRTHEKSWKRGPYGHRTWFPWPDFHHDFMIFQEKSSEANFWGFYAGFKGEAKQNGDLRFSSTRLELQKWESQKQKQFKGGVEMIRQMRTLCKGRASRF